MKKFIRVPLFLLGVLLTISCSDSENKISKEALQPTKPILKLPESNAVNVAKSITLQWIASTNISGEAIKYDVYVSETDEFKESDKKASDIVEAQYLLTSLKALCKYKWKVVAKVSESIKTESDVFQFTTIVDQPNKPELIFPANEAVDIETSIKLKWSSSATLEGDLVTYDVFYSKTNEFKSAQKINLVATDFDVTDLEGNTTYYWKVIANNSSSIAVESDVFSFKTKPAVQNAPELVLPANNAIDIRTSVNFTWTAIDANGTGLTYDFYIGKKSELTDEDKEYSDIKELKHTVVGLESSTKYYWKVVVKDGLGNAVSSTTNMFTTIAPAPIKLLAPINGFQGLPTELSWEVNSEYLYNVYISDKEIITEYDIKQAKLTVGSFAPTGLNAGVKYYWQIRAVDKNGNEALSDIYSFTTPESKIKIEESSFVDTDGRTYKTVIINGNEWLAENYAKLPAESEKAKWAVPNYKSGEIAYSDVSSNKNYKTYGLLYSVAAAISVVPDGWHIATDKDWNDLEKYLGMAGAEAEVYEYRGVHATYLKSKEIWSVPGTNETKLNILPAGYGNLDYTAGGWPPAIKPSDFGISAWFITSTKKGSNYCARMFATDKEGVKRKNESANKGYSVRLVKNK